MLVSTSLTDSINCGQGACLCGIWGAILSYACKSYSSKSRYRVFQLEQFRKPIRNAGLREWNLSDFRMFHSDNTYMHLE